MAALGFEWIELSHGIRITLVPGLLQAIEEGVVKISSTHNFCPLPTGIVHAAPNLFEPSSLDAREVEQWLRHTKRSIDFSAQVKSPTLVCHLGSVRFFWLNPARKLRAFPHRHPEVKIPDGLEYQALLTKSLAKLRKRMVPYWEQMKLNLGKVFEHAAMKGVRLAFENREKFEELPIDEDYAEFMAGLPASTPVGYWHDTGHGDIKETMGLLNHRKHLEKMAPRLLGFHLHDVDAHGQDHHALGSGHVDFKMVSTFWRPEHTLALEFGPRVTVEEVRESKVRLEALVAAAGL